MRSWRGRAAPETTADGDFSRLWTVADVCRFLGVSKRWVHERTRLREIPCYRFGSLLRFDPQEITAWAAKFHHPSGQG
jgi:excisionase family DNA binding protein